MSHQHSDGLKPVKAMHDDKYAFQLFSSLVRDLAPHLPAPLVEFLIGRARARDYKLFVETLPKAATALASGVPIGGTGVVLDRFDLGREDQIEAFYLAASFLAKYPFTGSKEYTEEYRKHQALRSFKKANKWCRRMNALGKSARGNPSPLIERARRIIREILPRFNINEVIKRGYYGPGVNVGVNWEETDAQVKLSLNETCTGSLAKQLNFAAELVPAQLIYKGIREARGFDASVQPDSGTWEIPIDRRYDYLLTLGSAVFQDKLRIVRGSKYASVPKNAKTERTIAAEPMLNSFLQNGTGVWMRDLIGSYTAQMDCSDQKRNRELAYAGASSGLLATIDLSSASDTVSMWLAQALLPLDWFKACKLFRSPTIEVNGEIQRLHMLSSMGNGYTFPMETLLFYAIARAAIDINQDAKREPRDSDPNEGGPGANREPSVYGDDIIVLAQDAPVVLKALRDCGFWPNEKKSFFAGPFRESCGHDYRGENYIRPVFLRRPLEWSFDVISLLNHLSSPVGLGWFTRRWNTSFSSLCSTLVDLARSHHPRLPLGPCTEDHATLHVGIPLMLLRQWGVVKQCHVSCPEAVRKTKTEYFYPLTIRPRRFKEVDDVSPYLASLLKRPEEGHFSLYSRVKRGEIIVALPRKDDLGRPILGWEDPIVSSLTRRYAAVLRRLLS